MAALLFPTPDALRLALATGVVPAAVARRPVAAGRGDGGEVWVVPDPPLPAECLPALARVGVRPHAPPPHFAPGPFPCWAAPLPLRPAAITPAGPVLVKLPAHRLAGFVASARRLRPQPVRFAPGHPFALAVLPHPPTHLLDDPHLKVYHEAAPGVWVRAGWEHPLPNTLAVSDGSIALVDPPGEWQPLPAPAFLDAVEVFPIRSVPLVSGLQPVFKLSRAEARTPAPTVLVEVKLREHSSDTPESLWAFDGPPARLAELFRTSDERVLSRFVFAVGEAASGRRVWAKPAGRGKVPVPPPPFRGFVPHPLLAGVFLPAGRSLHPAPRPDRLAALLGTSPKHLVCVDDAAGVTVHRVPHAAFRPLSELVGYAAPPVRRLTASQVGDSRLSFVEVRPADLAPPLVPLVPVAYVHPVVPPPGESWLARLFAGKRGKEKPTPKRVVPAPKASGRAAVPAVRAAPDRDARRKQAERAVMDHPAPGLWADLAAATADAGKPADAALCWVNALWDRYPPPAEWLAEWVRAEGRGKSEVRRAAAAVADIGFSPDPHPDAVRLPQLVRTLDTHEDELPVRAVWLARLGAARAVGGDPLSLARCRDRLLARLAADGPSLDLDAPAFVRFHGTVDGDRFRAARDWLLHVREPMQRWVHKLSTGLRLGWAGLDPDPKPTAAYADLMLAWGLSRLGERTKADELSERAERVLDAFATDPAVHTALVARFKGRIREARHGRGRPPTAAEPAPQNPADTAYPVAKLMERSRILAPHHAPNPYGGQDLAALLGTDLLAHRLAALVRQPSAEGVAAVLTDTAADPTAATLPRVILVAAELPVVYPPRTAERLMLLLPRAVELLPEAVRVAFDPHTNPAAYLHRLTARLVKAATRLAVRYDLNGGFGAFVRFVLDATAAGDGVVKAAAAEHLGELFAALRKLGLTDLAGELAGAWADRPVGWFALGRDDVGWQLLDAARERLFVTGIRDERERTAAAFEYVAALAHAAPRLALGRLEELFQRLDRVTTSGGTARYFALTPLELIDRAVSAVVTDEFNLGPAVRRWLDADEFAIRRRIARDLDAALATP